MSTQGRQGLWAPMFPRLEEVWMIFSHISLDLAADETSNCNVWPAYDQESPQRQSHHCLKIGLSL